jgi:hypothetical protein
MGSERPSSGEQEQAIKARKQLLFEEDETLPRGDSTPFVEYLRRTPAAPLSLGVRAGLAAAGIVAVLLLIFALIRGGRTRLPPRANTSGSTGAAVEVSPTSSDAPPVGKPAKSQSTK